MSKKIEMNADDMAIIEADIEDFEKRTEEFLGSIGDDEEYKKLDKEKKK